MHQPMPLVRAFRHGRLVTHGEARVMSEGWGREMDRFVRTRSEAEKRSVQLYVHEYLARMGSRVAAKYRGGIL